MIHFFFSRQPFTSSYGPDKSFQLISCIVLIFNKQQFHTKVWWQKRQIFFLWRIFTLGLYFFSQISEVADTFNFYHNVDNLICKKIIYFDFRNEWIFYSKRKKKRIDFRELTAGNNYSTPINVEIFIDKVPRMYWVNEIRIFTFDANKNRLYSFLQTFYLFILRFLLTKAHLFFCNTCCQFLVFIEKQWH